MISDNLFWVLDTNYVHFSPKKAFLNLNFGPADDKNAIETCF